MFAPNHCLHWDNGIILMAILFPGAGSSPSRPPPTMSSGTSSTVLHLDPRERFPASARGAIRRSLELLGARLIGSSRCSSIRKQADHPAGDAAVQVGDRLIAVRGRDTRRADEAEIGKGLGADHRDRKWEPARSNGWRGDVEVVFGEPDLLPRRHTGRAEATAEATGGCGGTLRTARDPVAVLRRSVPMTDESARWKSLCGRFRGCTQRARGALVELAGSSRR